jgi:hypothetical protein
VASAAVAVLSGAVHVSAGVCADIGQANDPIISADNSASTPRTTTKYRDFGRSSGAVTAGAALAAADAAAKETRITYETAAAAARTAEKTLDKARVEAGGRRPVRYQVSDDIGQRAFEKMIADRTYSTMLPADTSYYPHSSTEFLARMHAEGVEVNSNICDMWAWRNLKEIKNGDILYLVTSSNAHDWVPSKIYKGAVRSGPVHTLEANYGRDYQNHRNPTTSLKMTWEVSWRLLSDYDETYKDCFIDLTNGAAAVKITKPLPLPIASGALPPATEV